MAETTPLEPLLYSVDDATRLLSISRARLYELISAGELRASKIGRRTLIHRDELARFARDAAA